MQLLKFLFLFNPFFILSTTLYSQWTQISSSPPNSINDIVESSSILYLGHSSNGVYKSTDSTATWQQINNGLNTNQAKSVYQVLGLGETLYAATVDGIYKSTNGGDNWIKKSNGITIGPGALYEYTESIFENNNDLFTGAWNGIYRSTDGSENWILTNISGEGILAKSFTEHNGILFAARENINDPGAYKSTDGGITWIGLTGPFYSAITFFSEPTKFWMGSINGVWLSTDDGISWEHRSNGLSLDPYNSSIIRTNGNLITSLKFGGSGMFRSSDEGLNWEDFSEGLPFLNSVEKLIIYSDKIIAATSDGLWARDTSEIVTFNEIQNKIMPDAYELYQNHPNPFNPSTRIKFTLPVDSHVKIDLYSTLGEKVDELTNSDYSIGSHEINFDASKLSNGIYYYKINAKGIDGSSFTSTKKMILLK